MYFYVFLIYIDRQMDKYLGTGIHRLIHLPKGSLLFYSSAPRLLSALGAPWLPRPFFPKPTNPTCELQVKSRLHWSFCRKWKGRFLFLFFFPLWLLSPSLLQLHAALPVPHCSSGLHSWRPPRTATTTANTAFWPNMRSLHFLASSNYILTCYLVWQNKGHPLEESICHRRHTGCK